MRPPVTRTFLPLLAPLALAACNAAPDTPPGTLRPDEAQAIRDAAEMLASDSVRSDALTPAHQMDTP